MIKGTTHFSSNQSDASLMSSQRLQLITPDSFDLKQLDYTLEPNLFLSIFVEINNQIPIRLFQEISLQTNFNVPSQTTKCLTSPLSTQPVISLNFPYLHSRSCNHKELPLVISVLFNGNPSTTIYFSHCRTICKKELM